MPLPPALRLAIDAEVAAVDRVALRRAATDLSRRYRAGNFRCALSTVAERAAYLVTRLPATYAATHAIFRELARIENQNSKIKNVLDLGSGPGTALWAIAEHFPSATAFAAIERNAELVAVARRLVVHAHHDGLRTTNWLQADLRSCPDLPPHDVVVVSYAMGELDDPLPLIDWAWKLARVALVLVEPGTPKAFQAVLAARERLIQHGATIAAPCPHHNVCPLAARNDWCHFSVRLERTAAHRRLKEADLGYEDEKFAYLIAAKTAVARADARIVRHPLKHPGHVRLTLCTPDGLQTPAIGKSRKELYRLARNAAWGDSWPGNS